MSRGKIIIAGPCSKTAFVAFLVLTTVGGLTTASAQPAKELGLEHNAEPFLVTFVNDFADPLMAIGPAVLKRRSERGQESISLRHSNNSIPMLSA